MRIPATTTILARPHRPVYRMHRYFARRPYSIFAELVRNHTRENDIILDPFCGGGVTLVEAAIQKRKVIGFDINPLATFVTRMQLEDVDLNQLMDVKDEVCRTFSRLNTKYFSTDCRRCASKAKANWFEYSSLSTCSRCKRVFSIIDSDKLAPGTWSCPSCLAPNHFSPNSDTKSELVHVSYSCEECGITEVQTTTNKDVRLLKTAYNTLKKEEIDGLWIPCIKIPDCNMQRESALFKKGIVQFRQFFTPRHLLLLANLKKAIVDLRSPYQWWLLFAFSSTLRYTNKMVTRNIRWRGNRPLEWVKPGFWLPPVYLEANVLQEFSLRFDAIIRGKSDYLTKFSDDPPQFVKEPTSFFRRNKSCFHISTLSATKMPLPGNSVDIVITDPPYGSYIHYSDLSNFWSIWLPEINDLGDTINSKEEAVISRKNFPGSKNALDYQNILEKCFKECARVLKPEGKMILTFHNREPRAWISLLMAALGSGFDVSENGVLFQGGIPSYRHTSQSRRAGSIYGDFIINFEKQLKTKRVTNSFNNKNIEEEILKVMRRILRKYGPLSSDVLFVHLYTSIYEFLIEKIKIALQDGKAAVNKLIEESDSINLFDSHRRHILENYFSYKNDRWFIKDKN